MKQYRLASLLKVNLNAVFSLLVSFLGFNGTDITFNGRSIAGFNPIILAVDILDEVNIALLLTLVILFTGLLPIDFFKSTLASKIAVVFGDISIDCCA